MNKLDRAGANPWKVIKDLRNVLRLNAAAVQVPIGLEGEHSGVVDLIERKGYTFDGDRGEKVSRASEDKAIISLIRVTQTYKSLSLRAFTDRWWR